MADTLSFALVSPAREEFSGEVDHVIAPGAEGEFGVLPDHAPFMTTLRNGVVRVLRGGQPDLRLFVRGGFADVTAAGLTILAEESVNLANVDPARVDADLQETREKLKAHSRDDGQYAMLETRLRYLEDLRAAI